MRGGGILLLLLVASFAVIETTAAPQSYWDSFRNSVRDTYRNTKNVAKNTARGALNVARKVGNFGIGAYRGSKEMIRAYKDMKEANWKNSDKYFHARGNRDAARHGNGGKWAAKKISDFRELSDRWFKGQSKADEEADQKANRIGRNGGNINIYRPRRLPPQY